MLGNVINVVVFILKGWILVFVMMWVRWTLPRLRIDQVMMTCLKYLLPISCVLLLGVSLWQVAVPVVVSQYLNYVHARGVRLRLVVWMVWQGWRRRRASCRSVRRAELYDVRAKGRLPRSRSARARRELG